MDDAQRVCGKHACIQHPECRPVTERCGCPECRLLLSASREPAPGDVVALHSCGPDLTVLRVYSDVDGIVGDRVADLGWFTAAGEYRTGTLPLAVLRLRSRDERDSGAPEHLLRAVDSHDHDVLVTPNDVPGTPGVGAVRGVDACSGVFGSGAHPRQRNDAKRSEQADAPSKPTRTGYRDLNTGVYHPVPDTAAWTAHANECQSCSAERVETPQMRALRHAGRR